VELVINVPIEAALMEIDPVLFQQLIYNLANNAADACRDSDEPRVEISLNHIEEDKDSFTIAVRDNGSGIEPEMLKKAFESRFTTKSDGNGFGLMVCRKIIDAHQGALQISTDEGAGTTIAIRFPKSTANGQSAHGDTAKIDISAIESK
jgi:signal transduction histidine kinase